MAQNAPDLPVDPLAERLQRRLLEQCRLLSVTGQEREIADALMADYQSRGIEVARSGNSLVIGRPTSRRPMVLLVGHLDVVEPTDDDRVPRAEMREGRAIVVGRGTSDMKSGNVVAMEAFDRSTAESWCEPCVVLYAGEEGPDDGNELPRVLNDFPWLSEAVLAVVMEPTDGRVELGCLGGLHAEVTFHGQQAHSARPWHGRNALTLAGEFLSELDRAPFREVLVDGISYRDVWSATRAWTKGLEPGAATAPSGLNVIPDEFTINLNFRFAPSRDLVAAETEVLERIAGRADVAIIDRSPPAPPLLNSPVVAEFVRRAARPVAGKQAWTDVARFAQVGVPALNFGPGLTAQAHQRGEHVVLADMVEALTVIESFLSGSAE